MVVKLVVCERIYEGDAYCRSSGEVVLNGIAGGSNSRGDLDFAVDRSQVVVDGARADNKEFGNLGIGQSLCQEAQHFNFTGSQPIGISSCWPGW